MKKHNLHTHTTYSDGTNTAEEMLYQAGLEGLDILGISDHGFTRKTDSIQEYSLSSYINHLRKLKSESKQVDVRIGLEIDFSIEFGCYPQLLSFDRLNELDYVLFEYVDDNEGLDSFKGRSLEELVSIRQKLQIPVGLAHKDMQTNYYGKENEIAKVLNENDIFVEVSQTLLPGQNYGGRNTRIGIDYYRHFSQEMIAALKSHCVKFVIGTDNHNTHYIGEISDAIEFLDSNGLILHPMVL